VAPVVAAFEPEHAEAIAHLCVAEGWKSWTADKVAAAFSAPGVIAAVALEGDKVIGAGELLSDGHVMAYLGLLIVAPDARRQGIARWLIEELFARSRLERIDLLSEEESTSFYDALPHRSSRDTVSTSRKMANGASKDKWKWPGHTDNPASICQQLGVCVGNRTKA